MNPRLFGQNGEDYAAAYLQSLGWHLIARNVRMRCGELDIVAMDGADLVVVEVRARHTAYLLPPEASVGPVKIRRLIRTGSYFVENRGHTGFWRIDLIAITVVKGKWTLEHLRDISYTYLQ